MLLGKQLVGVRPVKQTGKELFSLTNKGGFAITESLAEEMGVKSADYVNLVEAVDENRNPIYHDGMPVIVVFPSVEGEGAKLASTAKNGYGNLSFSANGAYAKIGGNNAEHLVFDAEETVIEVEDEDGNVVDKTIWACKFKEKREKQERKLTSKKAGRKSKAELAAEEAGEVEEESAD